MKKLGTLLVALSLCAADSWQNKPATAWTDKDVQKILTNSPWAKVVSVSAGGSPVDLDAMPGRGRYGGDDSAPRGGADQMPGGSPGQGTSMPSRNLEGLDNQATSIPLTVIWESALPVKQALARRKSGPEAAASAEAKKFLEEDPGYLIALSGIPDAIAKAGAARGKAALLERTTLSAKGKAQVHPSGVEAGPSGKTTELIFVFPKTAPFGADDKEVEFSTQLGAIAVKYKFHPKEMLYQGKLEL